MYQSVLTRTNQPNTLMRVAFSTLLIAIGMIVAPSWFSQPVAAQSVSIPRTITVVGEGKVTIEPDIAHANIGVEVFNNSVADASAENTALIENIINVLMEEGVAEKDIQTAGFNIFAERYGPAGPLPENEVNYRVNNSVSIVIRELDRVGDVLDAAISAGANNIQGVNFQVEDPSSVESDARLSAVEDARAKAEELATLTGVGVGRVVSISEVIGGGGIGYSQSNFETVSNDIGGGGGGFAPGELGLVMRLQITYEIAEMDANAITPPTLGTDENVTEPDEQADDEQADDAQADVVPADTVQQGDTFEGTMWTVTWIQQDGEVTTTEIDQNITAQFNEGRLSGQAGCNTYGADYIIRGATLELSPAIATRMACPDEIMQREQLFLQALGTVTGFLFDGDTLALTDTDGQVWILFVAENNS